MRQVPEANLSAFFFAAYVLQGFACAQFGVVGQPTQYFLLEGLSLNAGEISLIMSIMMIPWIVKPVYGVISDAIPFLGYRRKSYLVLGSFVGSCAFLVMAQFCSLVPVLGSLVIAATCMAVSTALMVGLAVERGRSDGRTRSYFRIQELGYYLTNIFVVTGAGYLCHIASPEKALQVAAMIASSCALALSVLTFFWLREPRLAAGADSESIRSRLKGIALSMNSGKVGYIILLTCLWNFTMAYGPALYYHESRTLFFTQSLIGQLSAWMAAGMIFGAIVFGRVTKGLSLRRQCILTASLLLSSILAYGFLSTPLSAVMLEVFHGFANMFAVLTIYGLASDACPEGVEASMMSVTVAVLNLASCSAMFLGGQLFTHLLGNDYGALVLFASIPPALSLLLVCQRQEKVFPDSIKSSGDVFKGIISGRF
ncbi:MAG: MFS transporter [Cyanobacteria bacterium HKST-UBA02]|nr:MFS transporter [Cyanobacteria bacterium HKST-UBA02]